MDPKVTLSDAIDAFMNERYEEAREHLADYRQWRAKGGFNPRLHFGNRIGPEWGDDEAAELSEYLDFAINRMETTP